MGFMKTFSYKYTMHLGHIHQPSSFPPTLSSHSFPQTVSFLLSHPLDSCGSVCLLNARIHKGEKMGDSFFFLILILLNTINTYMINYYISPILLIMWLCLSISLKATHLDLRAPLTKAGVCVLVLCLLSHPTTSMDEIIDILWLEGFAVLTNVPGRKQLKGGWRFILVHGAGGFSVSWQKGHSGGRWFRFTSRRPKRDASESFFSCFSFPICCHWIPSLWDVATCIHPLVYPT